MKETVETATSDLADTLVRSTVGIVSAYVQQNSLSAAELPKFIGDVHASLSKLGGPPVAVEAPTATPAVSVRRSITPDALICLDCGKKFRTLKRHLATEHTLTPAQYRERWHLASDYPMAAPSYSERRSQMAKSIGLGREKATRRRGTRAR